MRGPIKRFGLTLILLLTFTIADSVGSRIASAACGPRCSGTGPAPVLGGLYRVVPDARLTA